MTDLSYHDPGTIGPFETQCLVEALIDRPVLADAATSAGVSLLAVHRKMRNDKIFQELMEEAINAGACKIEAEALRRAMGEVRRTVMHQGKPVQRINNETGMTEEVTEVVLSDRVLLKMLSALMPNKYGEKQEITHKSGTGVLVIPSSESDAAFEAMLAKMKQEAKTEMDDFEGELKRTVN
jgi:hypothetical protein